MECPHCGGLIGAEFIRMARRRAIALKRALTESMMPTDPVPGRRYELVHYGTASVECPYCRVLIPQDVLLAQTAMEPKR